MTGFLSFTTDSFKRRKELLHLFYIQVFVTFILYYLIILANILTRSFYTSASESLLNASVSNYWGAFYIILSVVALIFASAIVLFTLRLMMFYQTREISIMMAIGGLIETIENFYLVQLVLMSLASNLTGIIFGYLLVFASLALISIIIPLNLTLVIPFPDYQLVLIFVVFFFAVYMISAKAVGSIVNRYHEDLMQDKIDFNNGTDNNFISRMFIWGKKSKEGFFHLTTKITRLNIMRHSFVFIISIIINLIYAFFIVSLIFGTLIVTDTTSNISYTGIGGDNTAIILKKDFTDFFTTSFQLDSKVNLNNVNLTYSFFNYQEIMSILNSSHITQFDDRVILQRNIKAYNPATNVNPNDLRNNPGGNDLGTPRYTKPFVIAMNPEKLIPFWNFYGSNPKNVTGNHLFVGEQFAYQSFKEPMGGKMIFLDSVQPYFTVQSIVLDPLFKGNTVYINMDTYQSVFKPDINARNLIFVKLHDQASFNELSNELKAIDPSLSLISLSPSIQHNSDFITYLSVNLLFVGIPLFVIYFYLNDFYNRQIIEERKQQLNLLKILGANLKNYQSIIIKEVDGFSFWGLCIGYLFGIYFILEMTVPFPVISLFSILVSLSIIIIPYYIIRRRLIQRVNTIYQTYVETYWV